ncbi:ATP-binding protein [Streptomyces sp. NPDC002454]
MTVPRPCYYGVEVEACRERADQVRRVLAAHLSHWTLDHQVGPVCGGVGELFANVVEHTDDTTAVVELCWTGRHVIASVADRDRRPPRLLGPTLGGLARVAALSDGWGSCGVPGGGKVVWFTRRVESAEGLPLRWPAPPPALREIRHRPATRSSRRRSGRPVDGPWNARGCLVA